MVTSDDGISGAVQFVPKREGNTTVIMVDVDIMGLAGL